MPLLFTFQRIYQLLPPPYRDVWREWEDADKKHKENKKSEENKVCSILEVFLNRFTVFEFYVCSVT